jgi:hypothetical protein
VDDYVRRTVILRLFCPVKLVHKIVCLPDFILLQVSHSPLTITTETRTFCLSITGEKHEVVSRQPMVTCSCSPSLPPCYVVRCFEAWCPLFFEETGT